MCIELLLGQKRPFSVLIKGSNEDFARSCRVSDHADKERQLLVFSNVYAQFSKILLGVINAPVAKHSGVVNGAPIVNRFKMPTKLTDAIRELTSMTSDERCFAIGIMPRRKCVNVAPDTGFDLYSA